MRSKDDRPRTKVIAGLGVVVLAAVIAGCGSAAPGASSKAPKGTVTITLEGPNQWTTSGASFGPAWNAQVARFEKAVPGVKVKTVVLPLTTWQATVDTQLAAGTAPDMVFDQANYQPYMVTTLNSYLNKPNPFVRGNKKWIDLFNDKYYGFNTTAVDSQGQMKEVSFNMFSAALFYNKKAFAKAGVRAPIRTYADLIADCGKLKAAGYVPMAQDDSGLGMGWQYDAIFNMLTGKDFGALNQYTPTGQVGTNKVLTLEDWAKGILTKQFSTSAPQVGETMKLLKQSVQACDTPNWSGFTNSTGSMTDVPDFVSQKAAMTWGTDFAAQSLTGVKFAYGTMPFPTITKATTPLATNVPAQFGVSIGGTGYMIPSKIKGAQLADSIKFLQYMSAPADVEPWLKATGAVPLVKGAATPTDATGFTEGAWSVPMQMSPFGGNPPGVSVVSLWDEYLLGHKTLSSEESYLETEWVKYFQYEAQQNNWKQPWAKKAAQP